MSSLSRDLEAEGARVAEVVQAGEAGLVGEERRPSHQVVAAVVEEFRLERLLVEEEAAAAVHSRTVVAEEERLERWLEVTEVAQAHLLPARAAVVPGERWRLVVEVVPQGFWQVDPAPVGRSGEEEAARPIQGFSEGVVEVVLAG